MTRQTQYNSDTNADAAITFSAVAGKLWQVVNVIISYSAAPTGGGLKAEGVLASGDITHGVAAGGHSPLNPGWISQPGEDLVLTVLAGGAAVVGDISAHCVLIEASTAGL